MGKKVNSYQSDDGVLFPDERSMVLHEIEVALTEEFPRLRIQIGDIMASVDRISEIVSPLIVLRQKNHPEPQPKTTLEINVDYPTDTGKGGVLEHIRRVS